MNKLFLSNETMSMAVRDSLEIYFNCRCKVNFKKYFSLNYLSIVFSDNFGCVAQKLYQINFIQPTREIICKSSISDNSGYFFLIVIPFMI